MSTSADKIVALTLEAVPISEEECLLSTLMMIDLSKFCTTGCDISEESSIKKEKETLICPYSVFKVQRILKDIKIAKCRPQVKERHLYIWSFKKTVRILNYGQRMIFLFKNSYLINFESILIKLVYPKMLNRNFSKNSLNF